MSLQVAEMTMRLRDAENARNKRDRDAETMKRDFDQRSFADQEEIRQLRSSAEVAKAEIRQLRSEIAILIGQLEFARNDRQQGGQAGAAATGIDSWVPAPEQAAAKPLIEISEKALRMPKATVDF